MVNIRCLVVVWLTCVSVAHAQLLYNWTRTTQRLQVRWVNTTLPVTYTNNNFSGSTLNNAIVLDTSPRRYSAQMGLAVSHHIVTGAITLNDSTDVMTLGGGINFYVGHYNYSSTRWRRSAAFPTNQDFMVISDAVLMKASPADRFASFIELEFVNDVDDSNLNSSVFRLVGNSRFGTRGVNFTATPGAVLYDNRIRLLFAAGLNVSTLASGSINITNPSGIIDYRDVEFNMARTILVRDLASPAILSVVAYQDTTQVVVDFGERVYIRNTNVSAYSFTGPFSWAIASMTVSVSTVTMNLTTNVEHSVAVNGMRFTAPTGAITDASMNSVAIQNFSVTLGTSNTTLFPPVLNTITYNHTTGGINASYTIIDVPASVRLVFVSSPDLSPGLVAGISPSLRTIAFTRWVASPLSLIGAFSGLQAIPVADYDVYVEYTDSFGSIGRSATPRAMSMLAPVPTNCIWSNYSEFTACSVTCGSGTKTRTRTILVPATNGGTGCVGSSVEIGICAFPPCAQDCIVSNFSDPSPCAGTCGIGVTQKSRTVLVPRSGTGLPCPTLYVADRKSVV